MRKTASRRMPHAILRAASGRLHPSRPGRTTRLFSCSTTESAAFWTANPNSEPVPFSMRFGLLRISPAFFWTRTATSPGTSILPLTVPSIGRTGSTSAGTPVICGAFPPPPRPVRMSPCLRSPSPNPPLRPTTSNPHSPTPSAAKRPLIPDPSHALPPRHRFRPFRQRPPRPRGKLLTSGGRGL